MKPESQARTSESRQSTTEYHAGLRHGPGPRLRVTVVFSTRVGTLAALKKAGSLAKNLGARIVLVVPEVVPVHFPLDRPPVAVGFLERRQLALVSASRVEADEVNIEIYLCRDRAECLREVLKSPSLVVIGGKRRWWFGRERKLERYLRRLGHHVIFIEAGAKNHVGFLLHFHLRTVLRRLLGLHEGLRPTIRS